MGITNLSLPSPTCRSNFEMNQAMSPTVSKAPTIQRLDPSHRFCSFQNHSSKGLCLRKSSLINYFDVFLSLLLAFLKLAVDHIETLFL